MNDRLNEILEEIRELEKSIQEEIKRKEEEFQYTIRKGKVVFEHEVARFQRTFTHPLFRYLAEARPLNILTAPVIYAMVIPAFAIDACISLYQLVCFPIYGIPKVRRRDHISLDRHYLKYLNFIERLNCDYCSYFNGLASYLSEIGARTEQYWCPVKHASGKARPHSRYRFFLDYGDAEGYRARLDVLRRKFDDLEQ
jgi:hypothetical protein